MCVVMFSWMWRKKQRRSPPQPAQRNSNVEFVFENPLDGLLWSSDSVALLESKNTQSTVFTKHCPTSYCRYDFPYQKRTNLFTTLTELNLQPACSRSNPCPAFAEGRHTQACANQSRQVQNSVPQQLVDQVVDCWLHNSKLEHFLFVDAFCGFGSVSRAVAARTEPEVHVVANDRYRDVVDFDCSMHDCLEVLKIMGFAQMQAATPTLRLEEVAVLFWLSVPCTTYGPQGRGFHRPKSKPISSLAKQHDKLNMTLSRYLYFEL